MVIKGIEMNAKNYAIHFCFGLMMLALFASPWITNPGEPGNQIMASVALVNCFLYPFSKLEKESGRRTFLPSIQSVTVKSEHCTGFLALFSQFQSACWHCHP